MKDLTIIPADAGSTRGSGVRADSFSDHPRGCGEHASIKFDVLEAPGSSPRMRGARRRCVWAISCPGIIPADAGSTHAFQLVFCLVPDHPRGCGEHCPSESSEVLSRGSSPRMRGAPDQPIPVLGREEDHPRGCGEHRR